MQSIERVLSFSAPPVDDLAIFQEKITSGTCGELLKKAPLQNWMVDPDSAMVLWMHGQPGSGKSTKAAYLVHRLRSAGSICHYFFFRHDDVTKQSAAALLRCLAYQAAQDFPPFRRALQDLAEVGQRSGKMDDRQLWTSIFESILFKIKLDKPFFWVIDAIDESDSFQALISNFSRIPAAVRLRVVITGRPLPSISVALTKLESKIPLETIDVNENDEDIRSHVENEAACLRGTAEFQSQLVHEIVERAQGNFLWASLAIQECLESHSHEDTQRVLDEVPAGMEAMYERMELCITKLTRASDKSMARTILIWTTFAKRPLHQDELLSVLNPEFPSIQDLQLSIHQVCAHFVTINPSGRVGLIHQTAREYLINTSTLSFISNARAAHEELFLACVHRLYDPQMRIKIGKGRVPSFLRYASSSWPYHLERAPADSEEVLSELVKFFDGPHVLAWIELVASIKQLKDMVLASTVLTSFVYRRRRKDTDKNPLSHRLSELRMLESWALDLLKIIGKFGGNLLQEPSAIYKIIPQFCPADSCIHKQFSRSLLSQLTVSGYTCLEWDDLLSRISVGMSAQALTVASTYDFFGISASDRSLSLYNASTFDEYIRLEHGEHIHCIAFAKSGGLVAAYGTRTTKVWKTSNGELQCSSRNTSDAKALEMAFVDNDTALFMCTDLREIKKLVVQDSDTAWEDVHQEVFKDVTGIAGGVRNSPSAVRLNSDASQLAVAYRGSPLEAWDLQTHKLLRRCRRRRGAGSASAQVWTGVNKILWHSINGDALGIYTDGAVFKWHPYTEGHIELPSSVDIGPSEIDIAPNGTIFATSDNKGTVRLYNYDEFICIYQLMSEDNITGLCFTRDSRRFLNVRGSHCNIWEPNALIRLSELDDKVMETGSEAKSFSNVSLTASEARTESSMQITCFAAKQRGLLVCSGNSEGAVTLYEPKSDSKHELGMSTGRAEVDSICWTQDGRYLAYENLGGMLAVEALEQQDEKPGAFPWRINRILHVDSKLERCGARQILMNQHSELLLLADKNEAQIWDLRSRAISAKHEFPPAGFRIWCNHPRKESEVLAFKAEDITACLWTAEGLRPVHKWKVEHRLEEISESAGRIELRSPLANHGTDGTEPATDEQARAQRIDKVVITPDRKYLLLIYARPKAISKSKGLPLVRFIKEADLDVAVSKVPTYHLPKAIMALIERPFTVLNGGQFVFIDTSFWICTWDLKQDGSVGILDGASETISDASKKGLGAQQDASTISAEDLEKLGVTRHFFLPRDWVDANTLALCTVLDDGTFLCPRKGEIAVIRSGLGSAW